MRNIILAGNKVPANWEFRDGLENATNTAWDVNICVANKFDGLNKYLRYVKYFLMPFGLFLKRKKYKTIISWDQFFGITFLFYCRLFHVKKVPDVYIMTFIYREKAGLIGKIYRSFMRYVVRSGLIKQIYVFTNVEVSYYADLFGVPESLFKSEVVGIRDEFKLYSKYRNTDKPPYFIAPGRSNRDYDFLIRNWPDDEADLFIICDTMQDMHKGNIHVFSDVHGEDYMQFLAGAYAAVVPLKDEPVSSGQLVFEQAAMLGKPVITTDNPAVYDYVDDGHTGFIIEKSEKSLRSALALLRDADTYHVLCKNAREKFKEEFSLYDLGIRVGLEIMR